MKIYRILLSAFLISSVFYTTACPKKDAIRKAAEASYRLPGLTADLGRAIESGVAKSIFTADEARRFGSILEPIAKAERSFVQLVKAAHEIQKRTGTVPADQMARIKTFLDAEIITPFLKILEFYNVLSPSASAAIKAAIMAVRLVLTTIGTGFGSSMLQLLKAAGPGSAKIDLYSPKLEFA